jgi:hypothetical protein
LVKSKTGQNQAEIAETVECLAGDDGGHNKSHGLCYFRYSSSANGVNEAGPRIFGSIADGFFRVRLVRVFAASDSNASP